VGQLPASMTQVTSNRPRYINVSFLKVSTNVDIPPKSSATLWILTRRFSLDKACLKHCRSATAKTFGSISFQSKLHLPRLQPSIYMIDWCSLFGIAKSWILYRREVMTQHRSQAWRRRSIEHVISGLTIFSGRKLLGTKAIRQHDVVLLQAILELHFHMFITSVHYSREPSLVPPQRKVDPLEPYMHEFPS
jgi:hypothetical protein